MDNKLCILWDIQNVTPSRENGALFVEGLLSFINDIGALAYAIVVGDWRSNVSDQVATLLSEKGFELSHIPQAKQKNKKYRKVKDSVDFLLITKATEMLFQYPHIDTYLLVTGDIDFRPLLQIIKKHGKRVVVVYNPDNAHENLLEFADDYIDYRRLIQEYSGDADEEESYTKEYSFKKKEAYSLLQEAVARMKKENKIPTPGSVKVRMKMLNENFSGKIEHVNRWKDFILDAAAQKVIKLIEGENGFELDLLDGEGELPEIIRKLLETMKELSGGKKTWLLYTSINNKLIDKKIYIKDYNYSKFSKLMLDAEKRDLVETKKKDLIWYARLK